MRTSISDSAATWPRASPTSFRQKVVVIGSFAVRWRRVFWMLLARTVFGRHVRAIGDNEKAAEYAGLPIRRTQSLGLLALRPAVGHRRGALRGRESPGQSERRAWRTNWTPSPRW